MSTNNYKTSPSVFKHVTKDDVPMNDTFREFNKHIVERLGVTGEYWNTLTQYEELNGKVMKYVTRSVMTYNIHTEDYRLIFAPSKNGVVELFKIEVREQGKGIGNLLMNAILDVCDEHTFSMTLVPVGNFRNSFGHISTRSFLVDWYQSFGFRKSPFNAYFTYKP
jgi:GNAT superfamily N-acetyltransferase